MLGILLAEQTFFLGPLADRAKSKRPDSETPNLGWVPLKSLPGRPPRYIVHTSGYYVKSAYMSALYGAG